MVQTACVLWRAPDRQRSEAITLDRIRQRMHIERARVIRASAGGGPVRRVAVEVGVGRPMVWRWPQHSSAERMGGLRRDSTRKPS